MKRPQMHPDPKGQRPSSGALGMVGAGVFVLCASFFVHLWEDVGPVVDRGLAEAERELGLSEPARVKDDTKAPERPRRDADTDPQGALAADGWEAVNPTGLTKEEELLIGRAMITHRALGEELKAALTAALQEPGLARALGTCRVAAPSITASHQTSDIEVGRTAQRLRNPANRPPAWAAPAVEEGLAGPLYFRADDGRLGVMSPIMTAPLCLSCHGDRADMPPGLVASLDALYPSDEAVGFKAGELRGWFWSEQRGPGR